MSRLGWFIALVAWMGVIFFLSGRPGLGTGLGTWDLVLRKLAHIMEFAILTLLASMTFAQEGARLWRLALAAGIALLYAATDEIHQTFVRDRHGTPVDVAIDAIGISLVICWLLWRRSGHDVSYEHSE